MALPAWYNENQKRDYPFLDTADSVVAAGASASASGGDWVLLPAAVVVEFSAVMGLDAVFADGVDTVFLYSLSRSGNDVVLEFRTSAAGAVGTALRFSRSLAASEFVASYSDSEMLEALPVQETVCADASAWQGCLVTGDTSLLADIVADGESLVFPESLWVVEPARIHNTASSFLRSITLANYPRTLTTKAPGCVPGSSSSSFGSAAEDDVLLNAACLQGRPSLQEGYNCRIRYDASNSALIIGSGVGLGAGELCEEVEIFEDERQTGFLTGGPACNDVLKTINGVPGPDVTIRAGKGFRVYTAGDGSLVIDRSLHDFVERPVDSSSSLSSLSLSESGGA